MGKERLVSDSEIRNIHTNIIGALKIMINNGEISSPVTLGLRTNAVVRKFLSDYGGDLKNEDIRVQNIIKELSPSLEPTSQNDMEQ